MSDHPSAVQDPPEPDYVARMQLSIDLLESSRRQHNAEMACARANAAIAAWPMALEWRRAYALTLDNLNAVLAEREVLFAAIQWLEWGMIEPEGP